VLRLFAQTFRSFGDWMPAFAGMTSEDSPRKRARHEGMARRKAQTYGSAILADHGGRLSARHMR
jgi:hypothetical protein